METGVLIAIISAAGVIGSAFLQWRSNVKTLDSTASSMRREMEQRTAQSIREAEERRMIREEERAAEAVRSRLEDQARWLEKRQELHEAAIARLPELMSRARISASNLRTMRAVKVTRGSGTSIIDKYVKQFNESYSEISDDLMEMDSKLDLYGSNESSKAYSEVLAQLALLSLAFAAPFWDTKPADVERVSESQQQDVEEKLEQLQTAYDQYVTAARADLRTDQ